MPFVDKLGGLAPDTVSFGVEGKYKLTREDFSVQFNMDREIVSGAAYLQGNYNKSYGAVAYAIFDYSFGEVSGAFIGYKACAGTFLGVCMHCQLDFRGNIMALTISPGIVRGVSVGKTGGYELD